MFCGTLRNCSVGQGFEIYDKQNHDISKEDFMELINTVNGKMDLWEIYNNSIVNTYVLEEGFMMIC